MNKQKPQGITLSQHAFSFGAVGEVFHCTAKSILKFYSCDRHATPPAMENASKIRREGCDSLVCFFIISLWSGFFLNG